MRIKGMAVPYLRVEPGADIHREFYLCFTVSRKRRCLVLTAGRTGGVEIESMGPENLLVQDVHPLAGLQGHQIRAAFFHLGLDRERFKDFAALVQGLYRATTDNGLLLAEINPLVLTAEGALLCLDGKVEMDDSVVARREDLQEYFVADHHTDEENTASRAGLAFVPLGGWVGLMVNGAGLAMATMDLLNLSGLPAANFLDLGGGADEERMRTAFSLLFGDQDVEAVFVNLFGGILSCEKVALAMKAVLDGREPEKPMVVRMSGRRADEGLAVLGELGLEKVRVARDMTEAISLLAECAPRKAAVVQEPSSEPPVPADPPLGGAKGAPMPLPLGRDTAIMVQGITGREGMLHTQLMREYGAGVVCGVTPFKGGQEACGVPVFDTVGRAVREMKVDASVIFVPPVAAPDAIMEAAAAQIPWIVCITEHIPQHRMLEVLETLKNSGSRLIGPNTPGIIVPGRTKLGILPTLPFEPGPVALLSRSGTLTYEVAHRLTMEGLGQSICFGVGGDPFVGQSFSDLFALLRRNPETRAVCVLGEIGGNAEEELADYVRRTRFPKPVVSFIAGRTAPPPRQEARPRRSHPGRVVLHRGEVERHAPSGVRGLPGPGLHSGDGPAGPADTDGLRGDLKQPA